MQATVLHPGNATNQQLPYPLGWPAGLGGWSEQRLPGFETDMACDVDQYYASEITAKDLYSKYLAQHKPVLIRGLVTPDSWPAVGKYTAQSLSGPAMGEIKVSVSDIPYASKFGGTDRIDMSLREYVQEIQERNSQ